MMQHGWMTQLARRLGLGDAVAVGMGAMLGAGVFAALAPAAASAGGLLLVALAVAAVVATCNALSSAALAAVHPQAGGTYVYGRRQLGAWPGFVAGAAFVVGKTASCAAMALTVGAYAAPEHARAVAVAAVVALTAVTAQGITKGVALTKVLLATVLATLALVVVAALGSGGSEPVLEEGAGPRDVLQAAALLFFAFAGYARLATLGEEVRDPERTIPRAVPLALGLVLVVYGVVAVAALRALGPDGLAASAAPLADAAGPAVAPLVRLGAAVAALGVLLSLLLGVSRTVLAMARERDLPGALDAVSGRGVPLRAELGVAAAVVVAVLVADLRSAIGFSSFAVLLYYAVTNLSVLTLPRARRRYPPAVAVTGLAGCLLLALSLSAATVAAGTAVLLACCLVRALLGMRQTR
jgi:basic amino acid/polyamine antiporter, APA family